MWVRWGLWVPQSFVVRGITAFGAQSTYLVVTEATELWFWIPCNLVFPIGSHGEVAGRVHEWPVMPVGSTVCLIASRVDM